MPPPIREQSDFNRNLEIGAQNLSQFVQTLPNAAMGLTGLISSVKTASLGLSAFGAAILGPAGALLGLPGTIGAAGLQATMGLAGAASPNGLGSVDKAFDILAGTIGGLVQPAFVALGGLALLGADAMREFIKEHRADIIEFWTDAVVKSTKAVEDFYYWLNKFSSQGPEPTEAEKQKRSAGVGFASGLGTLGGIAGFASPVPGGTAIGSAIGAWLGWKLGNNAPDIMAKGLGIKGPLPGQGGVGPFAGMGANGLPDIAGDKGANKQLAPGAAGFIAKLADKMDIIARDIATSMGKPSITDPVSKWKEVAQAISQSELENRKMAMWKENMELLRDIIRAIREMANGGKAAPFVIPPWAVLG